MTEKAATLAGEGVQFPSILQAAATSSDGIVRKFDSKINMSIENATQSQQFKRWFGDWQKCRFSCFAKLRGIRRQRCRRRAAAHLPCRRAAWLGCARRSRHLAMAKCLQSNRSVSRAARLRPIKKDVPNGTSFFIGGAEGNRTPVRKQLDRTFFGHSLLFTFPYRGVNKHTRRFGRVMMHGRGNSYPPHVRHSNHTLARFVALSGRMGA